MNLHDIIEQHNDEVTEKVLREVIEALNKDEIKKYLESEFIMLRHRKMVRDAKN